MKFALIGADGDLLRLVFILCVVCRICCSVSPEPSEQLEDAKLDADLWKDLTPAVWRRLRALAEVFLTNVETSTLPSTYSYLVDSDRTEGSGEEDLDLDITTFPSLFNLTAGTPAANTTDSLNPNNQTDSSSAPKQTDMVYISRLPVTPDSSERGWSLPDVGGWQLPDPDELMTPNRPTLLPDHQNISQITMILPEWIMALFGPNRRNYSLELELSTAVPTSLPEQVNDPPPEPELPRPSLRRPPVGFCDAGSPCAAHEVCQRTEGDNIGRCHCQSGFVKHSQLRPRPEFHSPCVCFPSKILTDNGRCLHANRVYRLSNFDLPQLPMYETGSGNFSLTALSYLNEKLNLPSQNITCQVSCVRQQNDSRALETNATVDQNASICYIKFLSPSESFKHIPSILELIPVWKGLMVSVWSAEVMSLLAADFEPSLIEYDYCLDVGHDCDLRSTVCLYQPQTASVTCQCMTFHAALDSRSCAFDPELAGAHFRAVERYQNWLWMVLYVLIGLFAVAFFGLVMAILLLKTRPTKFKIEPSASRAAKISIGQYHNKLPRVNLSSAEQPLRQSEWPQSERPPSVTVTTERGPVITNPTYYPPLIAPVIYTPVSRSASPHPRPLTPQITPQEMSTFHRGQRLAPAPPPPPPPPAPSDHINIRVPLASSESSIDGLFLNNSNYSTPVLRSAMGRPASVPFGGVRLTGMNGTQRPAPEGTIISLRDSEAVREAIRNHRHSALLNLIHNNQSPQSIV